MKASFLAAIKELHLYIATSSSSKTDIKLCDKYYNTLKLLARNTILYTLASILKITIETLAFQKWLLQFGFWSKNGETLVRTRMLQFLVFFGTDKQLTKHFEGLNCLLSIVKAQNFVNNVVSSE